MDLPGIWGSFTKRILDPSAEKPNELHRGLNVIASSLSRLGDTIGNALEESLKPSETKRNDDQNQVSQDAPAPTQSVDLQTQLQASRDVAIAMAAKVKLLLRELKTEKNNSEFLRNRCSQLEDENKRLRDSFEHGLKLEEDDLVRSQIETLVAEKSRLAQENSTLARENQLLREVVEYHSMSFQDATMIDDTIEEVVQSRQDADTIEEMMEYASTREDATMVNDTIKEVVQPSNDTVEEVVQPASTSGGTIGTTT